MSMVGTSYLYVICPIIVTVFLYEKFTKYFKFLNTWPDPKFHEVVENVWNEKCNGNPMWVLHQTFK